MTRQRMMGALLIAIGLLGLMFALGLFDPWLARLEASPRVRQLPIIWIVCAALLVLAGLSRLRTGVRRESPEADLVELAVRVRERPLPFTVCVRCGAFADASATAGCPSCGARVDHHRVDDETDRATVLAAIGA
ncbi:MAG: hypothetical protein IPK74_26780 [Deltaproteobacteria bacterium]|nr:hypothetical protein [Deltaproteobacteria bacterium]